MTSALIGHTGFVGSNLLRQGKFDDLFNSKNIEDIRGRHFDRVVCAGAPGAKWYANQNPGEDKDAILRLISCLKITADCFTLISTIDYDSPDAYGRNRWMLEQFALSRFDCRIVRLPALFGPGLRKNALYDLMHGQRLDEISTESEYQWYPLRRLSDDLAKIEAAHVTTVNLVSEPIPMWKIRDRFFPNLIIGGPKAKTVNYDVRTQHADIWHGRRSVQPHYVLGQYEVFDEMATFLQEEKV